MIPFLKEDLINIPNAGVIPAGITKQRTINELGEIIDKKRVTHNASRPRKSGTSVNSLSDKDILDPCLFAFCLIRILNMIQAMRITYPSIPILLGKFDLDAVLLYTIVYNRYLPHRGICDTHYGTHK